MAESAPMTSYVGSKKKGSKAKPKPASKPKPKPVKYGY